jgi:hypothetical protein
MDAFLHRFVFEVFFYNVGVGDERLAVELGAHFFGRDGLHLWVDDWQQHWSFKHAAFGFEPTYARQEVSVSNFKGHDESSAKA